MATAEGTEEVMRCEVGGGGRQVTWDIVSHNKMFEFYYKHTTKQTTSDGNTRGE